MSVNFDIKSKKRSILFFNFGRNPHLSFTELLFYLKDNNVSFNIVEYLKPIIIIEVIGDFNLSHVAENLSSIVKCGIVISLKKIENINNLILNFSNREDYQENNGLTNNEYNEQSLKLTDLVENFNEILALETNNFNYSLSLYGFEEYFEEAYEFFSTIIEHHLKKEFSSSLKITLKHPKPTSLVRYMKRAGFYDFSIIKSKSFKDLIYFCKTEGAYDISLSKNKYEKRPFVDETIGTSIRIAKLLINLAGVKPGNIVLDPFCGLGTILQEALLNGCNVIGSDISDTRVLQCKENLKWISKKFNLKNEFHIFQSDVKKILTKLKLKSIDAIVTEPELGPLLKKLPNEKEARKIITNLISIYSPFFKIASELLKPNGRLVIILPKIRTPKQKFGLPINSFLIGTRLKIYNLFDSKDFTSIERNLKIPLIYREKWHKIERWIYVFRKF